MFATRSRQKKSPDKGWNLPLFSETLVHSRSAPFGTPYATRRAQSLYKRRFRHDAKDHFPETRAADYARSSPSRFHIGLPGLLGLFIFLTLPKPVHHGEKLMFVHNTRVQYTARVGAPNPGLANLLLEQFGGHQGELAAACRYFTQAVSKDDPGRKDLLFDIATIEP
jgi:hypothetical protein